MQPPFDIVKQNVADALREDIGDGDINAALIDAERTASARVVTRTPGIFCGKPWGLEACAQVDRALVTAWHVDDGDAVCEGDVLLELEGRAQSLLTVERTLINFVQLLSGTATHARRYVDAVAHTKAAILDTRKTIPGLRVAQKYAVAVGGARNHRMGLFDAYLLKENHIAAAGGITGAAARARTMNPNVKLEVEVENNEELREAIAAGVDMVLLDNYSPAEAKAAVEIAKGHGVVLEASGGITLANVAAYAEAGVDTISIGEITKNVEPLDLSMRITETRVSTSGGAP